MYCPLKSGHGIRGQYNIRLLSCLARTNDGKGVSLAQEVANALNLDVIAPDGITEITLKGKVSVRKLDDEEIEQIRENTSYWNNEKNIPNRRKNG